MGAYVVKVPDIGEGITEAELTTWHVKPGDVVKEDQPLADVMTDKATVEIPSPVAGKVLALGGDVGQMLAVGSELIRIETAGKAEVKEPVMETAAAVVPTPDRAAKPAPKPAPKSAPPPLSSDRPPVRRPPERSAIPPHWHTLG